MPELKFGEEMQQKIKQKVLLRLASGSPPATTRTLSLNLTPTSAAPTSRSVLFRLTAPLSTPKSPTKFSIPARISIGQMVVIFVVLIIYVVVVGVGWWFERCDSWGRRLCSLWTRACMKALACRREIKRWVKRANGGRAVDKMVFNPSVLGA